jgi:hypothetical protein
MLASCHTCAGWNLLIFRKGTGTGPLGCELFWRHRTSRPPEPLSSGGTLNQGLSSPRQPFFFLPGGTKLWRGLWECVMPKIELDGLPVIEADESETITVAVSADDLEAGDTKNPERHPVAIALRRQRGVDDARVSKREVLIRRGKQWFRYDPPKPVQS